jgi:hypothetical protein
MIYKVSTCIINSVGIALLNEVGNIQEVRIVGLPGHEFERGTPRNETRIVIPERTCSSVLPHKLTL